MSWELLNIISKPLTLDPLRFGMSCGGERGGVWNTHFSADTTKLCCSLTFASGMTQTLRLWRAVWMGSGIFKSDVVRFAEERSHQLSCKNTRQQLLQQPREHPCLIFYKCSYILEKAGTLEPIPPNLFINSRWAWIWTKLALSSLVDGLNCTVGSHLFTQILLKSPCLVFPISSWHPTAPSQLIRNTRYRHLGGNWARWIQALKQACLLLENF